VDRAPPRTGAVSNQTLATTKLFLSESHTRMDPSCPAVANTCAVGDAAIPNTRDPCPTCSTPSTRVFRLSLSSPATPNTTTSPVAVPTATMDPPTQHAALSGAPIPASAAYLFECAVFFGCSATSLISISDTSTSATAVLGTPSAKKQVFSASPPSPAAAAPGDDVAARPLSRTSSSSIHTRTTPSAPTVVVRMYSTDMSQMGPV
jgi:hypothetical protein